MKLLKNEKSDQTEELVATNVPIYDPNKQYTWGNDDKFELSGREFGLIMNTFRAILSTEAAAHIRLAMQCNDITENLMAKSVANGIIRETPPKTNE